LYRQTKFGLDRVTAFLTEAYVTSCSETERPVSSRDYAEAGPIDL